MDMSTPQQLESAKQPGVAEDPLLDKKTWHQEVETAVSDAKATGEPVAVLFIDVNHFKDINDTLGHSIGDEVIAEVRSLIQKSLRTTAQRAPEDRDQVAISEVRFPPDRLTGSEPIFSAGHIGGDEFGILCKTGEEGARKIVERLRLAFDNYLENSKKVGLRDLDISLAIGVSVLQPGMSGTELLQLADQDMYNDKFNQLPPLNKKQREFLAQLEEGLYEHQIRLRDVGKYLLMLSRENLPATET